MTPENCTYPVNFCTLDLLIGSSIWYYQRAINIAEFLGCPRVQISTDFEYFDQSSHFNDRGHTVPGDADFPMKEYYEAIKRRGFDGTVSFEICDRRYYNHPDKAIDDITQWMRANTTELD